MKPHAGGFFTLGETIPEIRKVGVRRRQGSGSPPSEENGYQTAGKIGWLG
jgi:hypothetical protein